MIITRTIILALSVALMANTAKAQLQVMPAVNVLIAEGDAFGVGSISGRYFISSHIATGINLRYVPTTRLVLYTGEADYFFNLSKSIRPFVGLEAGVFSKYRARTVFTTWGVAPKLGLQGNLTSSLGIQLDVSRPIAASRQERFGEDAGFLIGAGLNFSLGANR